MPTMIEAFLRKVASLHHTLFDDRSLLPHEEICLEAWRTSLPDNGKRILDAQLAAVRLVQHQADGATVCFYYKNEENIPLFGPEQPDLHAATVILRITGDTNKDEIIRVKVIVDRGLLFSIEFSEWPVCSIHQHGMQSGVLQVVVVKNHMIRNFNRPNVEKRERLKIIKQRIMRRLINMMTNDIIRFLSFAIAIILGCYALLVFAGITDIYIELTALLVLIGIPLGLTCMVKDWQRFIKEWRGDNEYIKKLHDDDKSTP